jgi:hypothetical protein
LFTVNPTAVGSLPQKKKKKLGLEVMSWIVGMLWHWRRDEMLSLHYAFSPAVDGAWILQKI